MSSFTTHPKARSEHPCSAKAECVIKPGQRYVRVAWPPWCKVYEDPEDPGSPLGAWVVERYHGTCQPYGYC